MTNLQDENNLISFNKFLFLNIHFQEKKEVNQPIIFGEIIFGEAGKINGNSGILMGGELNYQAFIQNFIHTFFSYFFRE